ncbi:MAG TPA: cytochrome P450 [Thermoanaerobaculia bacterium]|jgi:cytochrome P450|nr:cytochrome P450 [Thermoanaerobaculia bacterium]
MTASFPADPVAAVTHAEPYPYYADLVARAPFERHSGLGLWVAASAEAVTAVLTSDLCRVRPAAEPVPKALLGSSAADIFARLVRMTDGPAQQALKRAVLAALGSLDGAAAAGPSREWARRLEPTPFEQAFRLPAYVIGSLLGVSAGDLPELARRIGDFAPALAPGSPPDTVERGREAAAVLLDLLRSRPANGLLARLADEARNAGRDEEDVVLANAVGFLFQAHDATAGLIGNTLLALAARPDLRDPDLLGQVLPEVLRCDPPVQNTRRFVARDGLILGRPVKEGDAILVVLAAANRDPAANPDPDRFDAFRKDRRLFTFGIGPHACPGETLATTIAQAGVEAMLRAGLDLEALAGRFTYRPSANGRIPLFSR